MRNLFLSLLGFLFAILTLIGVARLRQFILEPDYATAVRCDAGENG